ARKGAQREHFAVAMRNERPAARTARGLHHVGSTRNWHEGRPEIRSQSRREKAERWSAKPRTSLAWGWSKGGRWQPLPRVACKKLRIAGSLVQSVPGVGLMTTL